jgi:hypothetical protein
MVSWEINQCTYVNDSAKVSFTTYKTTDNQLLVGEKITLTNTRQGETA